MTATPPRADAGAHSGVVGTARRSARNRRGPVNDARSSRTARWRVAVKLARRQVRRTWVSSLLIVALIVLPITAMAATAVFVNSMMGTTEEKITADLGQMQAWVIPAGVPGAGFWQVPDNAYDSGYPGDSDGSSTQPAGEIPADPIAALPAGTETIMLSSGQAKIETVGGVGVVSAWAGPVWDPRFEGRFALLEGRAPTDAAEVLVSPATLDRVGASIGGTLTSVAGESYKITGTFRAHGVGRDDSAIAFFDAEQFGDEYARWYLPDLTLDWDAVQDLNAQGIAAYSREVVLDPPPFVYPRGDGYADNATHQLNAWLGLATGLAVGGIAAGYMVVMLAGAAFAVSARRQQRALAIAASVGADARDLRRTVVMQGTVLGLVAGAVGTGAGIGVGILVVSLTDNGSGTMFWGLHVPWALLIGVLLFAALVGTISALVPAQSVTRTDTISALRGARRPVSVTAARPLWGSLIVMIGVGITVVCGVGAAAIAINETIPSDSPLRWLPIVGIIAGPILAQVGILLSGRWLLWLVSLPMAKMGIAPRIASRDALANGARTVPAFAAIAATVFVGVYGVALGTMTMEQGARNYVYEAPVGHAQVYFYESGPEPLTAAQADDAAAAATEALREAGATHTATVWRQPDMAGTYMSETEIDADLLRAVAVRPASALLADDRGRMSGEMASPRNNLAIVDVDGIETVTGVTLTADQRAQYAAGAALVLDPDLASSGTVEVAAWTEREWFSGEAPSNLLASDAALDLAEPQWTRTLDAIVITQPQQGTAVLVAPATADDLGLSLQPRTVFGEFPASAAGSPGTEQSDRLYSLIEVASNDVYSLSSWIETGPVSALTWLIPLLVGVSVLVLGASAVALGLARFERRPDDATLAAVGGTAGLRRRIGFWQGLVIAGFGTFAGAAAGILPPIGFWLQSQTSWQGPMEIADVPWWVIGGIVVLLPLAIALVNWLVPPRRPDLTRRTAIA